MANLTLAAASAAVCVPTGIVGGVVGGVAGGVVGGVVGTVSDNRELGKQVLVLRCSVDPGTKKDAGTAIRASKLSPLGFRKVLYYLRPSGAQ